MPRARTQFGSDICAETESEFATVIQAMPAASIAGTAIQVLLATAVTAVAADLHRRAAEDDGVAAEALAHARQHQHGDDRAGAHAGEQEREGAGIAGRACPCSEQRQQSRSAPASGRRKCFTRSRTASRPRRLAHELHPNPDRADEPLLPERMLLVGCGASAGRPGPRSRRAGALRANTQTVPALAIKRAGDQRADDARERSSKRRSRPAPRRAGRAAPGRARSPGTPASAGRGRCR